MNILFHSPLIFVYALICLSHFTYSETGKKLNLLGVKRGCRDEHWKRTGRCFSKYLSFPDWKCSKYNVNQLKNIVLCILYLFTPWMYFKLLLFLYIHTATGQPLTCEENQFKCMHRCIPISWRCDGDYDCVDEDDKTDEENCRKCDFLLELL